NLPVHDSADEQPRRRFLAALEVDVAPPEWDAVDFLHPAVGITHLHVGGRRGAAEIGSGTGAHLIVATVAAGDGFADGFVVMRRERETAERRHRDRFRPEEPPDLNPYVLKRRVITSIVERSGTGLVPADEVHRRPRVF